VPNWTISSEAGKQPSFQCKPETLAMNFLILKAYIKLIVFDVYLARGNFEALYKKVRLYPQKKRKPSVNAVERICAAVDMACIWYWKEALCLQRSAATACLLKQHGVHAQMVIGAQQIPFKAHAWVEVDGRVVNDKPYMLEIYSVVDRC
jgi:hypothetical protein